MPSARTQRYLAWLGAVGTFVSMFGCYLGFRNDMNAARAFLLLAWLILVPLFIYLIRIRSIASRQYRDRLKREEARLQRELEALATVEGVRAAGAEKNPDEETGGRPSAAVDPQPPTP